MGDSVDGMDFEVTGKNYGNLTSISIAGSLVDI
jgi:hypothetical protein